MHASTTSTTSKARRDREIAREAAAIAAATVTYYGPAGELQRPATMNDQIRPLAAITLAYVSERTAQARYVSELVITDLMRHDHSALARYDREGVTLAAWAINGLGTYLVRPSSSSRDLSVRAVEDACRANDPADRLRWYLVRRGAEPMRVTAEQAAEALRDRPTADADE